MHFSVAAEGMESLRNVFFLFPVSVSQCSPAGRLLIPGRCKKLSACLTDCLTPDNENLLSLPPGDTEAKRTSILDTFLDLGRNLVPDNLFQAAFQSVK